MRNTSLFVALFTTACGMPAGPPDPGSDSATPDVRTNTDASNPSDGSTANPDVMMASDTNVLDAMSQDTAMSSDASVPPADVPATMSDTSVAPDNCALNPDPIDSAGLDTNCDGADGIATDETFVAPNGSDSNTGTPSAPMQTIGAAIRRGRPVLIASGTYHESVTVMAGVDLYGGYNATFTSRVLGDTIVSAAAGQSALVAQSVNSIATVVEGIHFVTIDAVTPGSNNVAANLHGVGMLTLRDSTLEAGRGGDGAVGTPGTPGFTGLAGSAGGTFFRCAGVPCSASVDTAPAVGLGGTGCQLPTQFGQILSAVGGIGGHGGYQDNNSTASRPTAGHAPVCGAECQGGYGGEVGSTTQVVGSTEWQIINGQAGGNGDIGIDGTNGHNGGLGTWTSGGYVPALGTVGTDGTAGLGGGGGGGAQGTTYTYHPNPLSPVTVMAAEWAAAGSGGGGGGCGGGSGGGGQGGGASIAVMFDGTSARFERVTFQTHGGGHGGHAGTMGAGGGGGLGGPAVGPVTQTVGGTSGAGGNGGHGGNGGAGGNGAGGPSYGVVIINGNTINAIDPVYGVGAGGSADSGGTAGPSGQIFTVMTSS